MLCTIWHRPCVSGGRSHATRRRAEEPSPLVFGVVYWWTVRPCHNQSMRCRPYNWYTFPRAMAVCRRQNPSWATLRGDRLRCTCTAMYPMRRDSSSSTRRRLAASPRIEVRVIGVVFICACARNFRRRFVVLLRPLRPSSMMSRRAWHSTQLLLRCVLLQPLAQCQ